MKNLLISTLVILGMNNAHAASNCWFWQTECKAREALEGSEISESIFSLKTLCRPGDYQESVLSLRSFKGVLCGPLEQVSKGLTLTIAGFAELMCPDASSDYLQSNCHTYAEAFLKANDLSPKQALKKGVQMVGGKLTTGLCALAKERIPGSSLICGKDEEDEGEKVKKEEDLDLAQDEQPEKTLQKSNKKDEEEEFEEAGLQEDKSGAPEIVKALKKQSKKAKKSKKAKQKIQSEEN